MKQWCAIAKNNNDLYLLNRFFSRMFPSKVIYHSFAVAYSSVYSCFSPPQMLLGRCCWLILNQSLPGSLLGVSSRRARTSSACVPSTTWAEASSARRLTGGLAASTEY